MAKDYNARQRAFVIELYQDNETHQAALTKILNHDINKSYSFCGILHDKDTYEEDSESHKIGDLKKSHYHIVINFDNSTTRSAIAKSLKLDNERFIEPCEKLKGSLMYLIHYNTQKYQYDSDLLFGDPKYISKIKEIASRDNISFQYFCIMNYIENYQGIIKYTEFCKTIYKNGWYYALNKNQLMVNNAINQHNQEILKYS